MLLILEEEEVEVEEPLEEGEELLPGVEEMRMKMRKD